MPNRRGVMPNGTPLAEYALILVAIVVVAVIVLTFFGGQISQFVQNPPLPGNPTPIP